MMWSDHDLNPLSGRMVMACVLGRRSGRPENLLLWSRLSPSIVAIS
jgi:hypothetical protein